MQIRNWLKQIFRLTNPEPPFSIKDPETQSQKPGQTTMPEKVDNSLAKNRAWLENVFEIPLNKDVIIREFKIPSLEKEALIIFVDGLTDRNSQNFSILQPLMLLSPPSSSNKDPVTIAYQKLVPGNQVERSQNTRDLIIAVLEGSTVLLIDQADEALIIETKGWEHRGIDRSTNEPVVRGPQEAFTETFRSSTATVRRYIKDPKLVTEILRVGKRSKTLTAVMYIKDIVNPALVKEVKRRIESIGQTTDYIAETGSLEEYLEDHPKSIIPQMLSTERPDRLAAHLREGHVGIVMANSPYSLVIPTTFTIFLHAAEDYYLRWPFGNFLRIIRASSIFIALLLPSFYIAVVNYHHEMIPTDLMLAMTAAREVVPFPAIVEILFMEFSFELIREAGVRVPSVVGPTIGIVGALILGQAAVSASIVSPVLIIIIAITALASFVVPNYNASFTIRILRFIFIALAGFFGFFGIAFGIVMMTLHTAHLSSFGVPFLTPITPYQPENKDRILRPRNFDQPKRPLFLKPLDMIRQTSNPRRWDLPASEQEERKEKSSNEPTR